MTSAARIGYQNLLESGTVTASSENASYPVENAYDWLTFDYFRPAAGGTVNIDLTLGSAAPADYFAFFSQDLPSVSGTIKLQYWDGSAYQDCFSAITPTDNTPQMVSFTSQSSTKWRVVVTSSGVFNIGCISFGAQLVLERGMYIGWTPPTFGRATKLINSVSDGGSFLGRSVLVSGIRSSIEIRYASDSWMRTNWLDFVRHAETKPFFFVPDIASHPTECVFAYSDGDIPVPTQTAYGFMGVTVPIAGMVE